MLFNWPPLAIARRILLGMTVVFMVLAIVNAVGGSTFGVVTALALGAIAASAAGVLTVVERRRATG